MLPKTKRMTRQTFAGVFVSGRRVHTPLFQVILGRAPGNVLAKTSEQVLGKAAQKEPRYAVVVSKKVAQKAVERNALRRALYRALAEVSAHTPQNNHSVIVIAKKPARAATHEELVDALAHAIGSRSKSR